MNGLTGRQIKARYLRLSADEAERTGLWTPDMRHEDMAKYGHDLATYIRKLREEADSLEER